MFHFDLDDTLSLLKVFNFWATPPREGVPLVGEAKPLVEIFTTMAHKHEGWDDHPGSICLLARRSTVLLIYVDSSVTVWWT